MREDLSSARRDIDTRRDLEGVLELDFGKSDLTASDLSRRR